MKTDFEYTPAMADHLKRLEQRGREAVMLAGQFNALTLPQLEDRRFFIMDSIARYPHIVYYDTVQNLRETMQFKKYVYLSNLAVYKVQKRDSQGNCVHSFTLELPIWEISPDLTALLFIYGMPDSISPDVSAIPDGTVFNESSFYSMEIPNGMGRFPTKARELLSDVPDGALAYVKFLSDYSAYMCNTIMGVPDDFYKTTHYKQFLAWLEVKVASGLERLYVMDSSSCYDVVSSTGRGVFANGQVSLAHDHLLDYYEFDYPKEILSNDDF